MSAEPFSFAVVANDIPAGGRRYELEADEEQRCALAERLAVPEIRALRAVLLVRPVPGRAFTVRGKVEATVVQTCVVTLEPFPSSVEEEVDVTLMRAEDLDPARRGRDELVDAAESDGPELFHAGRIDLGVIAGEHLAIGLDPYPRAPGVTFAGHIEDDADAASPFAALAELKGRRS